MKKKLTIILLLFINKTYPNWAQETLKKLSLKEKIAQLFIIGVDNQDCMKDLSTIDNKIVNVTDECFTKKNAIKLIKEYKVGGIHFIKYSNIQNCANSIREFQQLSELPLLVSQDFEWGLSMRLNDAIQFPRNLTLGAIQNNELIYQMAKEVGRQCKLLGVHINFAPVVDINNNILNPVINDRSFGQCKENVAKKAQYFIKGLQDAGIIACAKHFPGHGDSAIDSHVDLPIINHSFERINEIELYPFKQAIRAGVKAIMPAHIQIPILDNKPASISYKVINNLLKKDLEFDGLVITDALNMQALTKYFQPGQIEREAFLAGNDVLLMSTNVELAIERIAQAINENKISIQELDKRVLKILKTKESLNLHNKRFNEFRLEDFHSDYANNLKKQLYENAITIVKNEDNLIPIKNKQSDALVIIADNGNNYQKFANQFLKYQSNLKIYYLDKNANQNTLKNLLNKLNSFEKLIINLFDLNKKINENYGITNNILDFLKELNQKNKIILNIFGNAYSLSLFKDFKNIIMSFENDFDAQDTTLKVLYTKNKAKGKLPILI